MAVQLPVGFMRSVSRSLIRPILNGRLPVAWKRRALVAAIAPMPLPRNVARLDEVLGGVPAERLIAAEGSPTRAVLYLHGGGYVVGAPATHRPITAHLAHASSADVHVPDYRLAPEHPYPAAVDDALAAYRGLLARGIRPQSIAIAGDSAGGGLVLGLTERLRRTGTPLPAALVLICPWLDLSLADVPTDADDPVLDRSFMEQCARSYARGDVLNPEVSPALMELAGLPRVLIQSSGDDLLRGEATGWIARAEAAGVDIEVGLYDDLWHVFQLHAGVMEAATAAVREIGRFLRDTLD